MIVDIDDNHIRTSAIDAVTEIVYSTGGVHEGTDKVVSGTFKIYVQGLPIEIYRGKRCYDNKEARAAAAKFVTERLTEFWRKAIDAMSLADAGAVR